MQKTLKKLWHNKWAVALAAGISAVLAFPCFYLVPTVFFFPALILRSTELCKSHRQALLVGFFISFVCMLGGAYWVTYVIHEFGYLPWSVSGLLFLIFCGFGALNFPMFTVVTHVFQKRLQGRSAAAAGPHTAGLDLWYVFVFPALFSLIEYTIPKLFPWYVGHCLYQSVWLIQIAEYTGSLIFTFAIFSLGGGLFRLAQRLRRGQTLTPSLALTFPFFLWALMLGVSALQLKDPISGSPLRVALIQANIGSLEKVQGEQGHQGKVRHTVDRYVRLTDRAMASVPPPDLILWPETAMPFQLENHAGKFPTEIRQHVLRWKTPLITGGYGLNPLNFNSDYNTAFLLQPLPDGTLRLDHYHKIILLAFGEYMPLGETFPVLYKQFPQVSNFERGKTQAPLVLQNGLKLGVTICYEAIVPAFFRKTASYDVNAIINLTNDSWFGPTSEPFFHGALTVFRAIETRKPLIRVANTGLSFVVDRNGRRGEMTEIYTEGLVVADLLYADAGERTVYVRYGDWFVLLLLVLCTFFCVIELRKKHVSLSR